MRVVWRGDYGLSDFVFVPGELLLSKESEYLIVESNMGINFVDYAMRSLGKIFTPWVVNSLFGGEWHFRQIILSKSTLHFGLGGALYCRRF